MLPSCLGNIVSQPRAMMDPPLRTTKTLPESSRVEDSLQDPFVLTSAGPISPSVAVLRKCMADLSSTRPSIQHIQDPSSDDMLGQFSFAPATQTTVVTTTTTTTTSFPPLIMKAPLHLHELDPKLYPLASSPTPKSIKKFHFNIAGRPTFFSEAEDTLDTLQEVCYHNQKNAGVTTITC